MCKTISTMGMEHEEWLRLRKGGIGGSDAGAVCGLNPYRSPMAVYWEKTTDTLDLSDNEAMRQGRDLENYVAQRFTEETGKKVRRSNKMYWSETHPFMYADVDRLLVREDAGLECKTVSAYNAGKWENGAIPMHYLMQCIHYMVVTGKRTWYIAAVILGQGFVYSRIDWDEEMADQLIALEDLDEADARTGWICIMQRCAGRIFSSVQKDGNKRAVSGDGNKIEPQAGYFRGNETAGEGKGAD